MGVLGDVIGGGWYTRTEPASGAAFPRRAPEARTRLEPEAGARVR